MSVLDIEKDGALFYTLCALELSDDLTIDRLHFLPLGQPAVGQAVVTVEQGPLFRQLVRQVLVKVLSQAERTKPSAAKTLAQVYRNIAIDRYPFGRARRSGARAPQVRGSSRPSQPPCQTPAVISRSSQRPHSAQRLCLFAFFRGRRLLHPSRLAIRPRAGGMALSEQTSHLPLKTFILHAPFS